MKKLLTLVKLLVGIWVLLLAVACAPATAPPPTSTYTPPPPTSTSPPAPSATIPPTSTPLPTPSATIPPPTITPSPVPGAVTITDEGNYYKVVIDYTTGKSPYDIMQEYGKKLSAMAPNIQKSIDQFLYSMMEAGAAEYIEAAGINVPSGFEYMGIEMVSKEFARRVEFVKPQLPPQYVEELEGLSSALANSETFKLGDGMLSKKEIYLYHLLPDVGRMYQCSAIGVFGPLSETGTTLVGRNFDLDVGFIGHGCITEIVYGDPLNSIYIIGWPANLSAFTAFNDHGVFGAVVDTTGSGKPYSVSGIYSYVFDLRYALEHETTLQSVADYLTQHPYSFNHLIFLADAETSKVLENNLSGTGSNMRRALRSSDSELNPGITWDFDNAIVAVSAFMLKGNHDNFTNTQIATARLKSYKMLLTKAMADGVITWNEIKTIQSYDGPDQIPGGLEEGDLYNSETRRIVVFNPATFKLEIFFSQDPVPPNDPAPFDKIPVSFTR